MLPDFGLYHNGTVELDYGRNGTIDDSYALGAPGSQVVAGDFSGTTVDGTAAFLNGTWSIDDYNNGAVDRTIQFGAAGDIPVAGDVFGVGYAALGIYNPTTGVWQFSEYQNGHVDLTIQDAPGGTPLLADYNNLGHAELILYNAGTWTVRNTDGSLVKTFHLGGAAGDVPVMTDFLGVGRADPGIFNDGSWQFDTNRDGTFDSGYSGGTAGDTPLVGYFDPTNSLFVAPGGTGNGTLGHPLGTIAAAIKAATTGTRIRLAAGNYAENLYMYGKTGVTFFGAGMDAVSIDPTSGDALELDSNSGTYLYNIDFASADRGLVLIGGDIYLRGISTVGSVTQGVLGTGYVDLPGSIDARHCHFNGMTMGDALVLQNDCTLLARGCTFDGNGTDPSIKGNYHQGRGLIVETNCSANARNCDFSNNNALGVGAINQSVIRIRYSTMSFTYAFDGAFVVDDVTAVFRYDTFQDNGPVRSVANGANGIEIGNGYYGPAVVIKNNNFLDNTSSGVFVGNGNHIFIANNIFNNNLVGVFINGVYNSGISTVPLNVDPTVITNTFEVPVGSTGTIVGVFALGSPAGGTIGGPGTDANLFENFPDHMAIFLTDYGYSPPANYGVPVVQVDTNYYINCPDPIEIISS